MLLSGSYISYWEEGTVHSECSISISKLSIVEVRPSDDGEMYEHLNSEEVEIDINGNLIYLEAEQGELTENGVNTLRSALKSALNDVIKNI